jgi:large subunit ribosomal protein L18e
MRRRMTNPDLISTIRKLKKKSKSEGAALWEALAEDLEKAKRRRVAVNLSRLNRNTAEEEVVAVPGKVLGSGELDHPLTVAAFGFSETAKGKIALAKGNCMDLKELMDSGITPSKIRIMK